MAETRQRSGGAGPSPLLDRLVGTGPSTAGLEGSRKMLTRDQVLASVQKELMDLINTRLSVSIGELEGEERTVLNYGFPDLSLFSVLADPASDKISEYLSQTIAAYEPRLDNVRVEVKEFSNDRRELWVVVSGDLYVGESVEPVNFPIGIAPMKSEND